ncbi:hypothetical protein Halru_2986 [Halovivax ruber XH-70]|uniref:Uncharacterized protein n=1 Tax=Halovivax ruber (strain DSM 18193 / JCM 13892 / XH-70) TaxID=797302 RepID=L0IFD6_HALRX|nr:helix-turn-helix transcriptional regulator [Halovivax ruber]AGB17553.1 hypothetical protein Halru_2986 [Halovivax ruber XH-70]
MTLDDAIEGSDETVIDAIGVLGNRRRLEVLLALAEAGERSDGARATLTFSELYDAVDLDSSSQFAYHLDRLVGPFLSETDDGYRLTYSANKIVRAIRSGEYESTPAFEARAIDGVCVFCESASLVATLEDEHFLVRCDQCASTLVTDLFPQSQSRGRTPAEIVDSFGHRIWSSVVESRAAVCPECHGRVDATVESLDRSGESAAVLASTCRECGFTFSLPVEVAAVVHPAAISHCWENGISLWDVPLWEFFEWIVSGAVTADVDSLDPVNVRFELAFGGDSLHLRLDDSLAVTVA